MFSMIYVLIVTQHDRQYVAPVFENIAINETYAQSFISVIHISRMREKRDSGLRS